MKLRETEQIASNTEKHCVMYHNELYFVPDDGVNVMRHGYNFDEDGNYSPGYWKDSKGTVLNYLSCEAWMLNDDVLDINECGIKYRKTGVFHPHFMFWDLGSDPNNILMMSDEDLWRYVVSREPDEDVYATEIYGEIELSDAEVERLEQERMKGGA